MGSGTTHHGFDEFLIYQCALSAGEISNLYASTCEDLEATPGSEEIAGGGYRYGFNGMEKDDEVKGKGNSYDFGARIYDSRLGRFASIDPKFRILPWSSPYSFANNVPSLGSDLNGELCIPCALLSALFDAGSQLTVNLLTNGLDFDTALNDIKWYSVGGSGFTSLFGFGMAETASKTFKLLNKPIIHKYAEDLVSASIDYLANKLNGDPGTFAESLLSEIVGSKISKMAKNAGFDLEGMLAKIIREKKSKLNVAKNAVDRLGRLNSSGNNAISEKKYVKAEIDFRRLNQEIDQASVAPGEVMGNVITDLQTKDLDLIRVSYDQTFNKPSGKASDQKGSATQTPKQENQNL